MAGATGKIILLMSTKWCFNASPALEEGCNDFTKNTVIPVKLFY